MAGTPRFTAEQVATALVETRGLISYAARRLGCEEQTIRNYVKRYTSVREALDAARGQVVDLGELRLYQAVDGGESWAVLFLLRTLGRERGYGEHVAITADVAMTQKEPASLVVDYDEYNRAYREAMGIVEDGGASGTDASGDSLDG